MFAVIYTAFVKDGCEESYQAAWSIVARYFVDHRGAIASCLHRRSDGAWVAYSRWPDKKTRDASWTSDDDTPHSNMPADIVNAISHIKNCLDKNREYSEVYLDVVEDV